MYAMFLSNFGLTFEVGVRATLLLEANLLFLEGFDTYPEKTIDFRNSSSA
jgi:hypothetical protein